MKRLFAKILAPLAISLTMFSFAMPIVAHADAFGLDETAKSTTVFSTAVTTKKTLPTLVGDILGIALSLTGLVFLGFAVYGGFRWMTAHGDTKSVSEGRDTLIDATIGIILVMAAYVITNFLFSTVAPAINSGTASSNTTATTVAAGAVCGNGTCDTGETVDSCPVDCQTNANPFPTCIGGEKPGQSCSVDANCGVDAAGVAGKCDLTGTGTGNVLTPPPANGTCNNNGTCDATETVTSCPSDCSGTGSGGSSTYFCKEKTFGDFTATCYAYGTQPVNAVSVADAQTKCDAQVSADLAGKTMPTLDCLNLTYCTKQVGSYVGCSMYVSKSACAAAGGVPHSIQSVCNADTGGVIQVPANTCGDGTCSASESNATCPQDCQFSGTGYYCMSNDSTQVIFSPTGDNCASMTKAAASSSCGANTIALTSALCQDKIFCHITTPNGVGSCTIPVPKENCPLTSWRYTKSACLAG